MNSYGDLTFEQTSAAYHSLRKLPTKELERLRFRAKLVADEASVILKRRRNGEADGNDVGASPNERAVRAVVEDQG